VHSVGCLCYEEKKFNVDTNTQKKIYIFLNFKFFSNPIVFFLLTGRTMYIIISKMVGRPKWRTCCFNKTQYADQWRVLVTIVLKLAVSSK
jgi:hypothetical protein